MVLRLCVTRQQTSEQGVVIRNRVCRDHERRIRRTVGVIESTHKGGAASTTFSVIKRQDRARSKYHDKAPTLH